MDDSSSKLYVARHKTTGLYHRHIQSWLWGNKCWMEMAKPSVAEVIEALRLAAERATRWTSDINNADVWVDYDIKQYQQYLPEVDFVAVRLSAVPLGASGS